MQSKNFRAGVDVAPLFGEKGKKKWSPKESHRAQRKRDDNNTRQVAL